MKNRATIAPAKQMSSSSQSPFTASKHWLGQRGHLPESWRTVHSQIYNPENTPAIGSFATQAFRGTPLSGGASLTTYIHNLFTTQVKSLSPRFGQRITQIANMPDDWDSEGARAVDVDLVANAYGIILLFKTVFASDFREPFVAPTFQGSVLIEWRNSKRSLEIEAAQDGWSVVGTSAPQRGEKLYHEVQLPRSNLRTLIDCYKWFVGAEMLWPAL